MSKSNVAEHSTEDKKQKETIVYYQIQSKVLMIPEKVTSLLITKTYLLHRYTWNKVKEHFLLF